LIKGINLVKDKKINQGQRKHRVALVGAETQEQLPDCMFRDLVKSLECPSQEGELVDFSVALLDNKVRYVCHRYPEQPRYFRARRLAVNTIILHYRYPAL
jgi:hypothetical protein